MFCVIGTARCGPVLGIIRLRVGGVPQFFSALSVLVLVLVVTAVIMTQKPAYMAGEVPLPRPHSKGVPVRRT